MPEQIPQPQSQRQIAFSRYYANRKTKGHTPPSGPFSEPSTTVNLRRSLAHILRRFSIRSIVDIGCGDWTWFSRISLPEGVRYTGMDIFGEVIAQNSAAYASPTISFIEGDAVESVPPRADLVICREVFSFLPLEDIQKLCDNLKRSNSRYLLASTLYRGEAGEINKDVPCGNWRYIDLCRPPFSFPPPIFLIPGDKPYHDTGLWRLENLRVFERAKPLEMSPMRSKYDDLPAFLASPDHAAYMNRKE